MSPDFERLLGDALKSVGEAYRPADVSAAQQEFFHRRRRRRTLQVAGGLALAGAAIAAAVVVAQNNPFEEEGVVPAVQAMHVAATIDVGDEPNAIAAGRLDSTGSSTVWVANSGDGTIAQVSALTNRVVAVEDVGGVPHDVAVTADAAWAADDDTGTVRRVATFPNENAPDLEPIPVAEPGTHFDFAASEDYLWVAAGDLIQIEGGSGTLVSRFPDTADLHSASDVAIDGDTVWALGPCTDCGRDSAIVLARRDAVIDNEASFSVDVQQTTSDTLKNVDLAAGEGAVWIADGNGGEVVRVDPATGRVAARTSIAGPYIGIATGEGFVWALSYNAGDSGTLYRLDPITAKIVGEPLVLSGRPVDVTVSGGAVWVSQEAGSTVTRVDIGDVDAAPAPTPDEDSTASTEAFAMWPEFTPEDAAAAVDRLEAGENPWRADAVEVATRFAATFDFPGATVADFAQDPETNETATGREAYVDLVQEPGASSIRVNLERKIGKWWWVVSVVPREYLDSAEAIGINVSGKQVSVTFDRRDAEDVVVGVRYGDGIEEETVVKRGSLAELTLSFAPTRPGYFYVLWVDDEKGNIGAAGGPLPAGDFAAG